ncbi:hypothetical protein AA0242T_1104 [Acetobacter aceti NRIC 0242]|uniref:Glycosyltransferase 2-like domain-containing protein n=1 Tax=Acetobacter aceti NBRC 14818 TaxID=887700 RepID=A0AB33II30_ACEAC|nr:glycosyltransferase [Acetobacter aceti]TCS33405.1 glycosyl transferase family 2 [Acetobacter aceti NBRC 14818]BCK77572.1 hypothetical protein EMQ_3178 [Acetobacter aceti NBRC 14818]GAN56789.1 glycosyl transferase family 2 [Acetobacter aceti NBRC 14818]GBO80402.1 hypothetical protein AA0242T_1104 [Acetobacter aceti NRIC 0242]
MIEGVKYSLDHVEITAEDIRIYGWLIAPASITNVTLTDALGTVHPIPPSQWSIPSPDVERAFGAAGHEARFVIMCALSGFTGLSAFSELHLNFHSELSVYRISVPLNPERRLAIKKKISGKLKIGIGVTTFNRKEELKKTISNIKKFTSYNNTLFIADDGSSDGTTDEIKNYNNINFFSGKNRGISWNKNRALYYLSEIESCDVIIILEDDTRPVIPGWEDEWINATIIHGHVNLFAPWFPDPLHGNGTWNAPYMANCLTAQCSAFSKEAIAYAGYFDSRFKGYGHEHIEHTTRLIKLGYGGRAHSYVTLKSQFEFAEVPSFFSTEQAEENRKIVGQLFEEIPYRSPWHNEQELMEFRHEMQRVISI